MYVVRVSQRRPERSRAITTRQRRWLATWNSRDNRVIFKRERWFSLSGSRSAVSQSEINVRPRRHGLLLLRVRQPCPRRAFRLFYASSSHANVNIRIKRTSFSSDRPKPSTAMPRRYIYITCVRKNTFKSFQWNTVGRRPAILFLIKRAWAPMMTFTRDPRGPFPDGNVPYPSVWHTAAFRRPISLNFIVIDIR